MIAKYRSHLTGAERNFLTQVDARLFELRIEVAELVRRRNKLVRKASKRPAREEARRVHHMVRP